MIATRNHRPAKIRILFVAPSLGGGGAEMHVVRLLNHLDRARFDLSAAVVRGGGSYETELASDVSLHVLSPPDGRSSTLALIRAVRPLRKLIRRERPDIVCSVLDHVNTAAFAGTRGVGKLRMVACVQNSMSPYSAPRHPLDRVLWRLLPFVYRNSDRVVALSNGVAGELRSMMGSRSDRITVIHNAGWDERMVQEAAEPLEAVRPPAGRRLVVAVGRLTEQKGYPWLLEAFQLLQHRVDAELWILGDGSRKDQLVIRAASLGLQDRVRFLGFRKNPFQFMAAADLFVLPSLWEGFGNVIVEAMAAGTPVLATDCPHGPAEIITSEKNGLIVPPADAGALADGMARLLTDAELRGSLARAGRRRAEDFSAHRIAAEYAQLFEEVTGSPAEGR